MDWTKVQIAFNAKVDDTEIVNNYSEGHSLPQALQAVGEKIEKQVGEDWGNISLQIEGGQLLVSYED